jgi:predicted RNA-binding protein
MCESTVYIEENGERTEVMADVAKITVHEDKIICRDILGESREVPNARIKEANLVDHAIILEKK